jgi:hypothetical protein
MTEPTKHECPFKGHRWTTCIMADGSPRLAWQFCGEDGWLCDRCKEDREDERNRKLVEAMGNKCLVWPYSYPTTTTITGAHGTNMAQCSRCGAWFSGTHTCFTIDPGGTQVTGTGGTP